jgi:hypothetical protein
MSYDLSFLRTRLRALSTLSTRLATRLRRRGRRERGVTSVEIAIAIPVIMVITLSIIEIGFDMWVDATVETAVQRASRIGIITSQTPGTTLEQQVRDSIATTLSIWAGRSPVTTIVLKSYPSYSAVGQGEPYVDVTGVGHYVPGDPYTDVNGNGVYDSDLGVEGTGGYGDIVSYHVTVTMDSFTGLPALLGIPTLTFSRSFIVQNEALMAPTASST